MTEEPSDDVKLNDLLFLALDHAFGSIADSGGPLVPFSVTEDENGNKTLDRYASEQIEVGEQHAKTNIENKKGGLKRYAVAWDGFVTIEGRKWDAILVEAGDKVAGHGILMCQRYEKKGFFRKGVQAVGNPALIGEPPSRIQ